MASNILISNENRIILPPLQGGHSRPSVAAANPLTCFDLLRTRFLERTEQGKVEDRLAQQISRFTNSLTEWNATCMKCKDLFTAILSAYAYAHPKSKTIHISFFRSKLQKIPQDSPYKRAANLAFCFFKEEKGSQETGEKLSHRFGLYLMKAHSSRSYELTKKFITSIKGDPTEFIFQHVFAQHTTLSTQEREAFTKWWGTQVPNPPKWLHFADIAIFRSCCELFHFARSTWNPSEPIEMLISELTNHGPMFGIGAFGRRNFTTLPRQYGAPIMDHPVLAWKRGSFYESRSPIILRPIVVIGAETKGNATFVYYQEPSDILEPSKKSPIYLCSYKRFVLSIKNSWGVTTSTDSSESGHLIYNTRFSP